MTAVLFVNSLLAGAAATAATFVAVLFARRASTRFALWFCALTLIVVLPFASLLMAPATVIGDRAGGSGAAISGAFLAWAAVALFGLGRVLLALLRARRLLCGAVEDERVSRLAESIRRELGCRRLTRTCLTAAVASPHLVGWWTPTIVMPLSFVDLDDESLRAILLHEMAHVARHDDWLIVAERVAGALFFFNPALLVVRRRLSFERELACDELACRHIGTSPYTAVLLRVARKVEATLALAAGGSDLQRRVIALHRTSRRWSSNRAAFGSAVLGTLLCAWIALPYAARRTIVVPRPAAAAFAPPAPEEGDGAVHFVNGRSLLSIGRYDLAIAELTRSFELRYETFASAYNIAVAYDLSGDPAAAREWLARAESEPGWTYSDPVASTAAAPVPRSGVPRTVPPSSR